MSHVSTLTNGWMSKEAAGLNFFLLFTLRRVLQITTIVLVRGEY